MQTFDYLTVLFYFRSILYYVYTTMARECELIQTTCEGIYVFSVKNVVVRAYDVCFITRT